MFAIDKKIEKLENQLNYLKSIKDDIEIEIADAGCGIADTMRVEVDNAIETIMSNIDFHGSELDEADIEDELREDLVEDVRMNF